MNIRIQGVFTAVLLGTAVYLNAQEAPRFTSIERSNDREILLQLSAPAGQLYHIDASANLVDWITLITQKSSGSHQHIDGAARSLGARFYRTRAAAADVLTGDHLATDAGNVIIHPINHASFVLQWQNKIIYNDPVGGASLYQGLPRADLILVSHGHGDHFDSTTLNAVKKVDSVIISPRAVFNSLSATLRAQTTVLTNGASTNLLNLKVEAVPAYNANHPKGEGNGYVVTIGSRRVYMSGDTGSTVEMRGLQEIDVAFLCMNLPYTMSVSDAATAVRAFRPKVVYPYHFRNQGGSFSDLGAFKQLVSDPPGIEVRIRDWY